MADRRNHLERNGCEGRKANGRRRPPGRSRSKIRGGEAYGRSGTADEAANVAELPLYAGALQLVSLRKNGELKNPVLRAYYREIRKTKGK